jgi:hypothetical protein
MPVYTAFRSAPDKKFTELQTTIYKGETYMFNRVAGEAFSRVPQQNSSRGDTQMRFLPGQQPAGLPSQRTIEPYQGPVRNSRTVDTGLLNTRGLLPGGCNTIPGQKAGCSIPQLGEFASVLKQALEFVSGLLERLQGSDKGLGSNGPGSLDPRELSPFNPPSNNGAARPGRPTVGSSPGLDLDGVDRGGGRKHPDCNLPKR